MHVIWILSVFLTSSSSSKITWSAIVFLSFETACARRFIEKYCRSIIHQLAYEFSIKLIVNER